MKPRIALALALALLAASGSAHAAKSIDDYRQFRALSIDLVGRMPTREEIESFEKDDFDLDRWIDGKLEGSAYVDRLTRVYMDLLRLEVSSAVQFRPPASTLRRVTITGPDGKPMHVWFRPNQRRAREATDGEFCLTAAESGIKVPMNKATTGAPIKVSQAALDASTTLVKPWWLYRDYRSATPVMKYGDTWTNPDPGYKPIDDLLEDAQDKPLTAVRVCKEEAQVADLGTIYASGRIKNPPGPPPHDRLRPLPLDDAYARAHKGEAISCRSGSAVSLSIDCGCGVGLEHCTPGDGLRGDGRAFVFPRQVPLGDDEPLDTIAQSPSDWNKFWWSQEAVRFFGAIFKDDRDFRESLTAKWTLVNGPLAQFYRSNAAGTSGKTKAFGMLDDGEPLFSPASVPIALLPHDVTTWEMVKDRGPRAAGLLTMPVFLTKYASRRARGAALYNTFLCKSFVSGNVMLMPAAPAAPEASASSIANLMLRPGCSTCHTALEPLAAYFARIAETDWRYLPAASFPIDNPKCKKDAAGKIPGFCRDFYDPAFSDATMGMLRGAYASKEHVEEGPIGAATAITSAPEFARCVVDRVASSFLGRPLDADDATLVKELDETFRKNGHRLRPLVRALVRSNAYRFANNMSSVEWRKEGGK